MKQKATFTWKALYWNSLKLPRKVYDAVDNKLKPYYCLPLQNLNDGVAGLRIHSDVGFFAQLNWCLYFLAYCEAHRLTPYIELTGPSYLKPDLGPNWLAYYFDNLPLRARFPENYRPTYVGKVSDIEEFGLPDWCESGMTLEFASKLIKRNLAIKPEIIAEIDAYLDRYFRGRPILGLHFRGTDKPKEAPRVGWNYCGWMVENYLETHPEIEAIFVASDEERFIEYMLKRFSCMDIFSHEDQYRSAGEMAVHHPHFGGDNYQKGREALINCRLLSKCSALIRSASFLSGWASVFNPGLPVVMLNRPYAHALWFPDREILRTALQEHSPEMAY